MTIEFYLAFWPLFGRLLADSLNYAFEFGELSNSQKQAITGTHDPEPTTLLC